MADAPTRISENQRVDGTLRATEDVTLAGRLYGRLECERTFTVEASGYVEAECFVKTLVVHGVVVGDIHASEDLIIERTGQVQGSIRARRMKLRAGGRISGQVATGVEVRLPSPRETATASAARRPPKASPAPSIDDWDAPAPARSAPRPARDAMPDVDELGSMPPRAADSGQRHSAPAPVQDAPAARKPAEVVEVAPAHEVETDHPGEVVETDEDVASRDAPQLN
ncbi:MAG: polymer-forming cytoskeletal protein [Myxococcota bacterium]